jgi:probable rRNA maturation factor
MEIDILIESRKWSGLHLERLAGDAVLAALDDLGLEPAQFAVSILACDDARIAGLNADFRGKPVPTNVLSWPSEERAATRPGEMPHLPPPNPVGPPGAWRYRAGLRDLRAGSRRGGNQVRRSRDPSARPRAPASVGFRSRNRRRCELMEGLETRILARLGVPDPY